MKIRGMELKNPVALAPMAGITDKSFRLIAQDFGVGLIFTEMISAKALSYKNIKTHALLDLSGETGPTVVQIFGSEPEIMAQAALKAQDQGAVMVDINMGCPVPKVVKNKEGSALLMQPELARDIVREVAATVKIPVSVKMRIGMDEQSIVAVPFARLMEEAGASCITVHGRTRVQYYSGKSDWTMLAKVKEALSVPLIGSGDIWKAEDAMRMLEETGVDGVMIGRGALGNPWLLGQAVALTTGKIPRPDPTPRERIEGALHHMDQMVALKGEAKAIPEMRKHLVWYLKGLPKTSALKQQLYTCKKAQEAKSLMETYLEQIAGE